MAVDLRVVRGETKKRAIAKATVEYGSNFTILGDKEIPVKSFFGFGKGKTEYEIRIMLRNSIYEGKKPVVAKNQIAVVDDNTPIRTGNLESEYLVPKKQAGTISSNEMADRLVAITKALKEHAKEKSASEVLPAPTAVLLKEEREETLKQSNTQVEPVSYQETLNNQKSLKERNEDIDRKVEQMVESKVRDMIGEYLSKRGIFPNMESARKEVTNTQLSEYENYIKYANSIGKEEKHSSVEVDNLEEDNNNVFENKNIDEKLSEINTTNKVSSKRNYKAHEDSEDECSVENYLEYLRERDFPKDILADIKDYLLTSSDARFFESLDVCKNEGLKYFTERMVLNDGIDINSKKKIIVLLGPTGVGKTTTLPKMAASYMKSGKKVAFLTIDNYRIAAVDQLERYASIMRVPFKCVSSPDALRLEVKNMELNSVLFVDTTGRSPKASEDIVALSKYFASVGRFDIDIQLVMSATVKYNDACDILSSFKPTNYKGVILTKTDETNYLAPSVCAIMKHNCPITYATFGQSVPRDISTGLKYKNKIIEGLYGSN